MEYEKIRQLMNDMGDSKLTEVNIDFPDGTKISMKKEQISISKSVNNEEIKNIETEKKIAIPEKDEKENIVKSPMVGTFYLKPSPTENPYIQVGDKVKKGDTLCIIEAMKLMNEIESEFNGTVTEILLNDGDTVQYGTPLFIIE